MGVELFNERWDADDDQGSDDLHTRMANRITKLCEQEDVDGIFVSIPSETPIEAIQKCLDLNIPVISVNAGADESVTLNLMHHIGMLEFNAGKGGGEFLIKSTDINHGLCINHAKGVNVVEDRCAGFQAALADAGLNYIGQVYVPDDNMDTYIQLVEEFVANTTLFADNNDWNGLGIIAAGGPQHIPVIALQARHEGAKIGAFDTSAELYDAVDVGIKEFGMDQQAYLQGYMPVVLLTYAATTGQTVSNQVVESGPAFIESSPSEEQQICEENHFMTCEEEEAAETPDLKDSGSNDNKGLIIGLVILAVVLLLAIVYFICRVNALNKHVAQLEAQGREVPPLTASQKFSSLVQPVESVVSGAAPAEPVSA